MELVGFVAVVGGFCMFSVGIGLIVGGVMLIAAGITIGSR